jgi:cytoskeleton protein RodZ
MGAMLTSRSEETNPATGFGEYLRREREMRGVSLEEMSVATKISLRFLEAIENEELSKLPGGIFTRSFVRSYAHYLGLDEERVLVDCRLAGQQKPEVDIRRITANRPRTNAGASRVIAFLVAGVLLAGGYALFRYSHRTLEQTSSTPMPSPPSTPANANPAAAVPPAPPSATAQQGNSSLPVATSGTPAVGAGTASPIAPGATASPDAASNPSNSSASASKPSTSFDATSALAASTDMVLQVAATERAWVAVDADGKTVLQKVLNANQVENLKAHSSFDITTGNALATVLTLNGETLKPLGRRGEVKSIHLTRDDVKNAAPAR